MVWRRISFIMRFYIGKKQKWKEKYRGWIVVLLSFLVIVLFLMENVKIVSVIKQEIKNSLYSGITVFYMPYVSYQANGGEAQETTENITEMIFPLLVQNPLPQIGNYPTEIESALSYEMILAMEAASENYIDPLTGELVGEADTTAFTIASGFDSEAGLETDTNMEGQQEAAAENPVELAAAEGESAQSAGASAIAPSSQKAVTYSLDKLADFDYLIQNFYRVDKTTTINSSQLNANDMLAKSMKLTHDASTPQILIYHTHSQEGYADSVPGDTSTTVVGVGDYLTELLTEQYGLNVIHHTGEYDVEDRDHSYSRAGPALEKLLEENPEIEVVIDLHRDGVDENTRLVTNVNGTDMAKIMFVNGLSRTTTAGDIGYLYNPNLADNLAFSFQVELAAAEYYPGFSRGVYLKGYRYNMHYCPKTILVEVGAQTNTLDEAKNAMVPLADILNKVLTEGT